MIKYDHLQNDPEFMEILEFLRGYVLAGPIEIAEELDLCYSVVDEHYHLAQAIVAEEINEGVNNDAEGQEMLGNVNTFLNNL